MKTAPKMRHFLSFPSAFSGALVWTIGVFESNESVWTSAKKKIKTLLVETKTDTLKTH